MMSKAFKILRYFFIVLILLIACCSPTRKNTYYQKRRKASHLNTEQLGRNRYFFSQQYQKKLGQVYKKKKRY